MSLSLNQRKNIRDSEAKAKEHLERIQGATGVEFTAEFDWVALLGSLDQSALSSYGDRIGEAVNDWYLESLARELESFCRNPIQKEAVLELASNRKITLNIIADEKEWKKLADWGGSYCRPRIVDGNLVIEVRKGNFCSNVSDAGANLIRTFAGSGPLPLASRVNIDKCQADIQTDLESITESTGLTFELEVDYAAIYGAMKPDSKSSYGDRIGECIHWYLEALASGWRNECRNPLRKEAIDELCTARKITFSIVNDKEWKKLAEWGGSYCRCRLVDGVLVMEVRVDNFCSNVSGAYKNSLIKTLTQPLSSDITSAFDRTFAGNGPLPLATRVNIAREAEHVEENMAKINEATGLTFEFECDYAAVFAICKGGSYDDRLGEVIVWYLEGAANSFSRFCKNPLRKEAVEELATQRKIAFRVLPSAAEYKKLANYGSSYCRTRLVDGMLVMETHKDSMCSNVSEVMEAFDTIFMGSAEMPLAARVKIADTTEERDGYMQQMSEALGKQLNFEVDWASLTKTLQERGYADRHGEVMCWYLSGLVYYIKRICGDELGKEALQDKFSSGDATIRFLLDKSATGYVSTKFEPNQPILNIRVNPSNLGSNVSDTGADLEKQL